MLKYGNLMLPAEHVLDLYFVRQSNATPFCKYYAKLYFDPKHLEKGLNRVGVGAGVKFLVPFFQKSAFSGQYRTLPYIC